MKSTLTCSSLGCEADYDLMWSIESLSIFITINHHGNKVCKILVTFEKRVNITGMGWG